MRKRCFVSIMSLFLMMIFWGSFSVSASEIAGMDISDKVDVFLDSIYNNTKKEFVVQDGKKQNDSAKIHKNDSLEIKYKWEVKEFNIDAIKKDRYFKISLPAESILGYQKSRLFPIEMEMENGAKEEIGKFEINNGCLKAIFTKDLAHNILLKEGKIEISANVKAVERSFDIKKDSVNEISLSIEKDNRHYEHIRIQNTFPPIEDEKNEPFTKGGYYNNSKVEFYFDINRDQIQNIFKDVFAPGRHIQEKRNVYIVDEEIPDGLEIIPEEILLRVPFWAPALENNRVSDKTSKTEMFIYDRWARDGKITTQNGQKFFDIEECENPEMVTWEDYKQKIISKSTPTIGIWKRKKMVVKIGDMPNNTIGYGDCYETKKISEQIDECCRVDNGQGILSTDQASCMKSAYMSSAYGKKPLVNFEIRFFCKIVGVLKSSYLNKAVMKWDNNFAEAEKLVNISGRGSIKCVPFKSVIDVTKKWVGETKDCDVVVKVYYGDEPTKHEAKLNKENQWQHRFSGIEKKRPEEENEKYHVKEENIPEGYRVLYKKHEKYYSYTVINIEQDKIIVRKEWEDEKGNPLEASLKKPVTVSLYAKNDSGEFERAVLYKKNGLGEFEEDTVTDVVLDEYNNWQHEYTVDKYRMVGNKAELIEYEVREKEVPEGFEEIQNGNKANSYTILNKKKKVEEQSEVVEKGEKDSKPETTEEAKVKEPEVVEKREKDPKPETTEEAKVKEPEVVEKREKDPKPETTEEAKVKEPEVVEKREKDPEPETTEEAKVKEPEVVEKREKDPEPETTEEAKVKEPEVVEKGEKDPKPETTEEAEVKEPEVVEKREKDPEPETTEEAEVEEPEEPEVLEADEFEDPEEENIDFLDSNVPLGDKEVEAKKDKNFPKHEFRKELAKTGGSHNVLLSSVIAWFFLFLGLTTVNVVMKLKKE